MALIMFIKKFKFTLILLLYKNDLILLTGQLTGPLSVSSTTSDRITVSWTAPQRTPTSYIPTSTCTLICSDSLLAPLVTTTTSSSTSVAFFNLPPGSKCNITLTAQYGTLITNKLMVTATTLSESEQAIDGHVPYASITFLLFVCFFVANRTIGCTHWLCCCVSEQLICHPDME